MLVQSDYGIFTQIIFVLLAAFLVWLLLRYIKAQPEILSKNNISKGLYTLGMLALALIAFIAFGIFVLKL